MKSVATAIFVLVSVAALATNYTCAAEVYKVSLTGNEIESVTSGRSGGVRQYIGEIPDGGFRGVEWHEAGDIPCHFDSHMRYVNNGYHVVTGKYFNGCGPSNWGNKKSVMLDSDSNLSPGIFVRGVSICDNDKDNHRLKGIRLYSAKVWDTRKQIDTLSGYVGDSHSACKAWKPAVYCASGTIATSMVLHVNRQNGTLGSSSDAVWGISLLCRKVEWS